MIYYYQAVRGILLRCCARERIVTRPMVSAARRRRLQERTVRKECLIQWYEMTCGRRD